MYMYSVLSAVECILVGGGGIGAKGTIHIQWVNLGSVYVFAVHGRRGEIVEEIGC